MVVTTLPSCQLLAEQLRAEYLQIILSALGKQISRYYQLWQITKMVCYNPPTKPSMRARILFYTINPNTFIIF